MNEINKEKDVGVKEHMDYGEYLVRYGNEKLREFFLQGPINDQTLSFSVHTLNYLKAINDDPITVLMHTYGGDIHAGLAIFDLIARINKKVPVHVLATGACMSMGVIILQAGKLRLATKNSHFMLHQLRGTNEGDLGSQRDSFRQMENLQSSLNDILAHRTGKTPKQIDKLIDRKDYYISAPEALKMNLIDKIVED